MLSVNTQSIVGYVCTQRLLAMHTRIRLKKVRILRLHFKCALMYSELGQYYVQCKDVSELKLNTSKHGYSDLRHSLCVRLVFNTPRNELGSPCFLSQLEMGWNHIVLTTAGRALTPQGVSSDHPEACLMSQSVSFLPFKGRLIGKCRGKAGVNECQKYVVTQHSRQDGKYALNTKVTVKKNVKKIDVIKKLMTSVNDEPMTSATITAKWQRPSQRDAKFVLTWEDGKTSTTTIKRLVRRTTRGAAINRRRDVSRLPPLSVPLMIWHKTTQCFTSWTRGLKKTQRNLTVTDIFDVEQRIIITQ